MIDPIAIEIGAIKIYWYGIMVATGWMLCLLHWNWFADRDRLPRGFGMELAFWLMLSAIAGARIAYVLANFDYYRAVPLEIFQIQKGGLIFYGGFIGCALATVLVARRFRTPLWVMADFAILPIPLGHAIGRIGCFLNGCCFGKTTDAAWAPIIDGVHRHPTPLYETLVTLMVYGVLMVLFHRKKKDGVVFAWYLVLYPIGRFCLEFVRGDDRMRWLGLTVAQNMSIAMILIGCILLFALPKKLHRAELPSPNAS